jgi:spore germination protein YaaH
MNQLWYDDSISLSHKYDWVKNKKLSGVGIWALGYDHGDTELWELLANKFGEKEE